MRICRITLLGSTALLSALFQFNVYAWGERGHDLVTRLAVQELRRLSKDNPKLVTPFVLKDHMLSHLSNVPDFIWRSPRVSERQRKLNFPTHFVNLETALGSPVVYKDIPDSYAAYAKLAAKKGKNHHAAIGSAPWRVMQFYNTLVNQLKQVNNAATKSDKTHIINQALLYAGLMSHFVADLANPHHTTVNFDGQLSGNTGLHAYFESNIIRQLPLSLAGNIKNNLDKQILKNTLLSNFDKQEAKTVLHSPMQLVKALVANSHQNITTLHKLDNKYAVLTPATSTRKEAKRRPARQIASAFSDFAEQRLAIGAAVLAQLWWLAWREASQPDMRDFFSHHYFVVPDFIDPGYLPSYR